MGTIALRFKMLFRAARFFPGKTGAVSEKESGFRVRPG